MDGGGVMTLPGNLSQLDFAISQVRWPVWADVFLCLNPVDVGAL